MIVYNSIMSIMCLIMCLVHVYNHSNISCHFTHLFPAPFSTLPGYKISQYLSDLQTSMAYNINSVLFHIHAINIIEIWHKFRKLNCLNVMLSS